MFDRIHLTRTEQAVSDSLAHARIQQDYIHDTLRVVHHGSNDWDGDVDINIYEEHVADAVKVVEDHTGTKCTSTFLKIGKKTGRRIWKITAKGYINGPCGHYARVEWEKKNGKPYPMELVVEA